MKRKEELIRKIKRIDDPGLIDELDRWISSLIELRATDTFSKKEISSVSEGYKQYLAGETVTQSEAERLFDKWLKEK